MDRFCNPNNDNGCPERVVCRCLQVTEAVLVEALADGEVRTLKDIRRCTGAGDGCTACHALLRQYLERHAHSAEPICSVR
ncbi:MAG TPA: (2Fe-2S)-binding protein [Gemmataceae bacterium]|nr:(2Fe-2S)-binding protein [Gemmataceae bacterium]